MKETVAGQLKSNTSFKGVVEEQALQLKRDGRDLWSLCGMKVMSGIPEVSSSLGRDGYAGPRPYIRK